MNVDRLERQNVADQGAATAHSSTTLRVFLWGYALFLLALIVIQVTFTKRGTASDEDGLYNAIYMYQHYGKVTYPMQLQFDYMTVHPPTHYFVVGVLARAGLQIFHAAAAPLVLLALFAFVGVLTSSFSDLAKFFSPHGLHSGNAGLYASVNYPAGHACRIRVVLWPGLPRSGAVSHVGK